MSIRIEGKAAIVGAQEHPHAARRLRQEFPGIAWFDAPAGGAPDGVPSVHLRRDDAHPEGGFAISATADGAPRIEIAGGPFSGVIYGVEELVQRRARHVGAALETDAGSITEAPALPYRTWWNWDHTTNWDTEQIGVQEIGVMNPYAKPEDGFLKDYKRAVDFMSRNRISAVTIFGFFRESHGGIEAAQELCRYANERGVRIMPGVAINSYGGVVWEMDHPYNLATWLRKHPHLAAKMERRHGFQIHGLGFKLHFPNGDYSLSGCPSRPENQAWMEEGIAWLAETCDIGGVNIEAGDYGVCGCDLCRARRPDAWVYSEIQWDNLLDQDAMHPLRSLPEGGIYQHTLNRPYWERVQRELTKSYADALPTKNNVFRCQFACQWGGDERTERYHFNGRDWMDLAKKAAETGFQGLTVWGEQGSYSAATELGYLAFSRFCWDPSLTWERFIAEDCAPLLGGVNAAERFIALTETIDHDTAIDAATLDRMRDEALDGARQMPGLASGRWITLADRIARRRYNDATRVS